MLSDNLCRLVEVTGSMVSGVKLQLYITLRQHPPSLLSSLVIRFCHLVIVQRLPDLHIWTAIAPAIVEDRLDNVSIWRFS